MSYRKFKADYLFDGLKMRQNDHILICRPDGTIEDLVEEIVGEIRDEHEKIEVVRESEYCYVVPGNMDVDRLVEMFGIRPEGKESATVAGLVSELAGRIPHRGDVIEEDGLRFEVLDSTERRVERVRISVAKPTQQMKLI